jgi:anti-anti-sigma factor
MHIGEERTEGTVILGLSGRLDATTAKMFEERILGVIGSAAPRLVVDLAQLEYISSAGLRVLLLAAKRLAGTERKMVLCSLQEQVRQVFDIAGFSAIFSIYNLREDAIKSF